MAVANSTRQIAAIMAAAKCSAKANSTPLDYIVEYQAFIRLLDYFGDGGSASPSPQSAAPGNLPSDVSYAAFRR